MFMVSVIDLCLILAFITDGCLFNSSHSFTA